MSRTGFIIAALLILTATSGCATKSEMEREHDELWRAGYGFNNPNPERIKQGQDPLNFDGSKPKPWWLDW